jgi:hypothetical protein
MSHNSYNSIKKYAAFLFMVFTVLSGSSENFDSGNVIKVGKNAFVDILAINKLFIQGMKAPADNLGIKNLINGNEDFRNFLDIDADTSSVRCVQFYILLLVLTAAYLNNSIAKNNTWRSTLF